MEENEVTFDEISKGKIACMKTFNASQAYCLCLGHYCNKDSLLEQAERLAQRLTFILLQTKQTNFLLGFF